MKLVRQQNTCDCGIAAVAMALGLEYDQAAAGCVLDGTSCGMTVCSVRAALESLGGDEWRIEWHGGTALADFTPEPGSVLLIASELKNERHYVAVDEAGLILCPIQGGPTEAADYGVNSEWGAVATVV